MTVTLDSGDAEKILNDVREARALAADVAGDRGVGLDHALDLAKRLRRSDRLLRRAIEHEGAADATA